MSTVPWGAAFPTEWPRKRIKYLCRFAGGGTPDKGNPEYWNGEIPWLSPKDMKSATINDTEDHVTTDGLESSATKLIAPGAVLLVMRSGILRHSIPVAINRVSIALNQDMRALIPFPQVEARFLARLLEGHQQQLLNVWSKVGSTVESLESDLVAETEIAVPALDQQRAIADYLDRETARLDALVAAKERVLGLLAEKRRALITRAVTRGLDPDAPLRDSGIPWLGEIPEHWEIVRLRFLATGIEQGWSPEAAILQPGLDEWGVLKLNAVNQGRFDEKAAKALPPDAQPRANLEIHPGNVLVTRSNTPLLVGDACFVETTRPRLMLSDIIFRLTVRTGVIDGRFLVYFLTLPVGRVQIENDARGTSASMVKISQEHIKNWWIPVPTIAEQRSILTALAGQTRRIDQTRAATERTIALLKERRAALIAAAVTGQIEVEDFASGSPVSSL